MKKILAVILLTVSAGAMAHGPHGHWRHSGGNWNWVAPVIVGGVIGYELARPPAPQPVVIQQQPIIVPGTNCSPWTQIQNPDGTITSTRTCTQ